jgi:hypothetical protein
MTILTVQLVFDADDPDAIMRFWGRALGYDNELVHVQPDELTAWRKDFPQYAGRGRIDDTSAHHMPVYIQKVPEPKNGRNRLRPEIVVPDVDALRSLGAGGTGAELTDVEGNEFSVEQHDGEPRMRSVVFDCLDPDRMLEFWSQATGYEASGNRCDPPKGKRRFEGGVLAVDGRPAMKGPHPLYPAVPDGEAFSLAPGLAFVQADEPKRTKNRLHVDLWTMDPEANRDRLIALGATVQRWDTEHVMLDPEGNEFCAG